MMNKKGILLLNYLDKKRKMNYVTKDDQLLVITMGTSNKVAYMKENKTVDLQFGEEVVKAKPEIISNQADVKAYFEFMNEEDNNHFRSYNENFVAVKLEVLA